MRTNRFEFFAARFADLLGTSAAFIFASVLVLVWVCLCSPSEIFEQPRVFFIELCGMFVFLKVFILQRSQNKEMKALHLKLDELIASMDGASIRMIKAEKAPEEVVDKLHNAYEDLAETNEDPTAPISINTANKDIGDSRLRSS